MAVQDKAPRLFEKTKKPHERGAGASHFEPGDIVGEQ
jgi:hypothetical protein